MYKNVFRGGRVFVKKKRRILEQMRKKKAGTKRVLAAFLALALAGSYIPSIPASAEEPDAELLLDFDFEGADRRTEHHNRNSFCIRRIYSDDKL